MLTPQDVRSVQFEKNLRGYRTEDVDRFLLLPGSAVRLKRPLPRTVNTSPSYTCA